MNEKVVSDLTHEEIVDVLVSLDSTNEVVALLADLAMELKRRLGEGAVGGLEVRKPEPTGRRAGHATTVFISGSRWREFFIRRRIPQVEVGPLIGLCRGYGSAIQNKERLNYFTADRIATALNMRVDDFIWEIGDDVERSRVGCDG